MDFYTVTQTAVHTFDFADGTRLALPCIETVQTLFSESPIDIRRMISEALDGAVSEHQLKDSVFVINERTTTKEGTIVSVKSLVGFDTNNMQISSKPHFKIPLPDSICLTVEIKPYNDMINRNPNIKEKRKHLLSH